MKIRFLAWLCAVGVMTGILYGAEAAVQQRALEAKTIRLHVVAHSDGAEDQARKLRVRDAVLCQVHSLTGACTTAREAEQILSGNLERIRAAAAEKAEGYPVTVTLLQENFPTRHYDTFSLPAGTYSSLRVRIGAARGKNWWCVVFPTLCTAATGELEACARAGGYTEDEVELIRGEKKEYVFRFKTLEWLQRLREIFS